MMAKVNGYSCICEAVIIFLIANSCIGFELRISNSLLYQITLNGYTDVTQKFIDCMRAKDSRSCNIYVHYWNSWYIDSVYKETDVETTVAPVYSCSLIKYNMYYSYYSYYYVECKRQESIVCYSYYDCNVQELFRIKWNYQSDFLTDTNLSQCLYWSRCTSYANIITAAITDTTTTLSSTSTLKTKPTTSWQYVTTERQYKTPTNISSPNNWNSTNSSETEHSSNTTIIIIAVIISVCLIVATVIVVYCFLKRYRLKNTTSANIYVNDSTVNNNQFISMKSVAPSTLETVSGDIEQPFQNKHNDNTSKAYFNIFLNNNRDEKLENSMSYEVIPVNDGVYLNTSSSDVIDKTYSRLGEQVRVIADDYNSLLPEDEHSNRFIDSTTIPEEMKDNASNKTENTEYALVKDTMSITDTPTNPYSLAKVVST
ncbi:uncharacterized protein LOC129921850 [Biomphalaria glabrata]|uniref:Uncharacterized protein LOC129921850 n=1 Tax=Biomphalaria glabrata TaxID=6526 RepID=A0A9W2YE48_BIOGL|nr:uncharacterized protein LOC129921850 [Biomphalaria glabrata]